MLHGLLALTGPCTFNLPLKGVDPAQFCHARGDEADLGWLYALEAWAREA